MSILGHSFNIDLQQVIGTPTVNHSFNEFDELGILLSIERLPEEKNIAYKQRILDVMAHRSGSHYLGLVYGITRELGLSMFHPIRIYPRKNSNGSFLAPDPVCVFSGPIVTLYSDYYNEIKELEFDRFAQDEDAYQIVDLANYISDNSQYFNVNILEVSNSNLRAMTILTQKNTTKQQQVLSVSNKITLDKPGLDGGLIRINSVVFSDKNTYATLVDSSSAVTNEGDYYLNPITGFLYSFQTPTDGSTIHYEYIKYDWKPHASEVIIHSFENADFQKKLFEQVKDNNGNIINGLPTQYGSDFFNELVSVFPLYYNA